MKTVVISLTEKEIQWLDLILIDKDKEDALKFAAEVIKQKVKAQEPVHCGEHAV
jgi:hypothetical protein